MLARDAVLGALAATLSEGVVVASLGNASRELFAKHDTNATFYMLGSMGMPVPFGLGVALSSTRPVFVLEGDGGCLMNLGALATVARYGPSNMSIVIFDNESYESTGVQPSHTRFGADLAGIARSAGIKHVRTFSTEDDLLLAPTWIASGGPRFGVFKVEPTEKKAPRVELSPPEIYRRFRHSLTAGLSR